MDFPCNREYLFLISFPQILSSFECWGNKSAFFVCASISTAEKDLYFTEKTLHFLCFVLLYLASYRYLGFYSGLSFIQLCMCRGPLLEARINVVECELHLFFHESYKIWFNDVMFVSTVRCATHMKFKNGLLRLFIGFFPKTLFPLPFVTVYIEIGLSFYFVKENSNIKIIVI